MPELSSDQMEMIRNSSSDTEEFYSKLKLLTDDVTYHTIKTAMERAYSDLGVGPVTVMQLEHGVVRIVKDYPIPPATENLEDYYYRIIFGQRGGGKLKKRRSKKRKSKKRKSKKRKSRKRKSRKRKSRY